jgi:hypothetical protein
MNAIAGIERKGALLPRHASSTQLRRPNAVVANDPESTAIHQLLHRS